MKIYPSSIGRLLLCPGSKKKPPIEIRMTHKVQIEGVAVGWFCELYCKDVMAGIKTNIKNLIALTNDKYDCDITSMAWNAIKMIKKLSSKGMIIIGAEFPVKRTIAGGHIISSRIDIQGEFGERTAVILDWKGGFVEYSPLVLPQLKSYCLAIRDDEKYDVYKTVACYLRGGNYSLRTFRPEDLEEYEKEIVKTLKREHFSPGDHCMYCPLNNDCEAKSQVIKQTINDLALKENMNPSEILELKDRVAMVKKSVESYELSLKQLVKEGKIEGWYMKQTISKTISFSETSKILMQTHFSEDEINDFLKVDNKKLEEALKEKTPDGLKGAEWKAFKERFEDAGCIIESEKEKLTKIKE